MGLLSHIKSTVLQSRRCLQYKYAFVTLNNILLASLLATGCATMKKEQTTSNPSQLVDETASHFANRAADARRHGELNLAYSYWEVAALLRPNNMQYQVAMRDIRFQINSKVDQAAREANQAQLEGKYEAAEMALLRALRLDPENVETQQRIRHLETTFAKILEVAKLEKTRRFYLNSEGTAPSNNPAIAMGSENPHQLGIELLEQGKIEAAIGEFKTRLHSHPGDRQAKHYLAQANLLLAEEQDKEGNHEQALDSYNQAKLHGALNRTDYNQRAGDIKIKLADQFYNQGLSAYRDDLANAIRLWEKALTFNPNHSAAAIKLKQALTMQRNLQRMGR